MSDAWQEAEPKLRAVTNPSGRTMHPFGKIMSPSGGVISSVPQQPFHRSQNMLLWRILNPISIQRSPSPLYAQRRLVCVGANKSETGKQARRRATRGSILRGAGAWIHFKGSGVSEAMPLFIKASISNKNIFFSSPSAEIDCLYEKTCVARANRIASHFRFRFHRI